MNPEINPDNLGNRIHEIGRAMHVLSSIVRLHLENLGNFILTAYKVPTYTGRRTLEEQLRATKHLRPRPVDPLDRSDKQYFEELRRDGKL